MEEIKKIIERNAELFERPNVISVEPGYLFRDGWITSTPAIIVTVQQKLPVSGLLDHELIPDVVEDVPVDIIVSDTIEQALSMRTAAIDLQVPTLHEDFVPAKYTLIPGNPIDNEFLIKEQILCHVSPDMGWPVLKQFILEVKSHLTIAMYDFNAAYIAKTLITALNDVKADIDMILDDDV